MRPGLGAFYAALPRLSLTTKGDGHPVLPGLVASDTSTRPLRGFLEGRGYAVRVPTTAIFSRSDGICAWQVCMEKPAAFSENIEV